MQLHRFSEQEERLFALGAFDFIAVDPRRVNLEDLLNVGTEPGTGWIVRCDGDPSECIRLFSTDAAPLGCVAGWISEDESEASNAAQ